MRNYQHVLGAATQPGKQIVVITPYGISNELMKKFEEENKPWVTKSGYSEFKTASNSTIDFISIASNKSSWDKTRGRRPDIWFVHVETDGVEDFIKNVVLPACTADKGSWYLFTDRDDYR